MLGRTRRTTRLDVSLAIAFAALAVLAARMNAAPAKQNFTDRAITAAVSSDLHFDPPLQPYSLGITTTQ